MLILTQNDIQKIINILEPRLGLFDQRHEPELYDEMYSSLFRMMRQGK